MSFASNPRHRIVAGLEDEIGLSVCDDFYLGTFMTMAPSRGLLPILFAVLALVLSALQAAAVGHAVPIDPAIVAHDDISPCQKVEHPLHAKGCCSKVFCGVGLPLSIVYGVPCDGCLAPTSDDAPAYPHLRSGLFRPPRFT